MLRILNKINSPPILLFVFIITLLLTCIFFNGQAKATCTIGTDDPKFGAQWTTTGYYSWASVRANSYQRYGFSIKNGGTNNWASPGSSTQLAVRMYAFMALRKSGYYYWNNRPADTFGGNAFVDNSGGATSSQCDAGAGVSLPSEILTVAAGGTWTRYFDWQATDSNLGQHAIWMVIRTSDGTNSYDNPNPFSTSPPTGGFYRNSSATAFKKHNWSLMTLVVPYLGLDPGVEWPYGSTSANACNKIMEASGSTYSCGYAIETGVNRNIIGLARPSTLDVRYTNTSGGLTTVSGNHGDLKYVNVNSGSQNVRLTIGSTSSSNRYYFKYSTNGGSTFSENLYNRDIWAAQTLGNTKDGTTTGWTISVNAGQTVQFCAQVKNTLGDISRWSCMDVVFQVAPAGTITPNTLAYSPASKEIYAGDTATFRHWITSSGYTSSYTGTYHTTLSGAASGNGNLSGSNYSGSYTVSGNYSTWTSPVNPPGQITHSLTSAQTTGLPDNTLICESLYIDTYPATVTRSSQYSQDCFKVKAKPTVKPTSERGAATVAIGSTVTFTHKIVSANYPSASYTASWSNRGEKSATSPPAAGEPNTQIFSGTQTVSANTTYTVRTNAFTPTAAMGYAPGDFYCENLDITSVSNANATILTPDPSTPVCVQVTAGPTVKPTSERTAATVTIGSTVTFTHKIQAANYPSATYTVNWSNRGEKSATSPPAAGEPNTQIFSGTQTVSADTTYIVRTNAFTPTAALYSPGDFYCENLDITSVSNANVTILTPDPSTPVCVEIKAQPGILPVIEVEPYIEAGEPVVFTYKATATEMASDITGNYTVNRQINAGVPSTVYNNPTFTIPYSAVAVTPILNTSTVLAADTSALAPGNQICDTLDLTSSTPGVFVAPAVKKCVTIVSRPYVKFFGSDVAFCSGASGNVYTAAKTSGAAYVGSSTQYALFAKGVVDGPGTNNKKGFFSRSAYATKTPSDVPKQLTFANNDAAKPFGGGFGNGIDCSASNYYVNEYNGDASKIAAIIGGGGGEVLTNASYPGKSLSNGVNYVVYRNGNVLITGNVTYSSTTWSTPSNIPSFRLIVNGDIYIGKNVTQLDGFYFATGNIYTCDTLPTVGTFYNDCKNQLKVYGALQALGSIKYWRTSSTLNKAAATENSNPSAFNYAAETIIFSPEMYFSKWRAPVESDSSTGQANAVSDKPPVF